MAGGHARLARGDPPHVTLQRASARLHSLVVTAAPQVEEFDSSARAASELRVLRGDADARETRDGTPASAGNAGPSKWCWSAGKRAVDLLLGIVSLPIVIPLTAVLSCVSAIRFRCNPFFVQARLGVDETVFKVVKIRSLPADFDERRGKHELDDHTFEGWSAFLRDSHLDELPQFWNVLNGSMSLVGPRPMIDEVVVELEPQDRANRARVKPGLTGPWQVSTMGLAPLHDHPELDNLYVERASWSSDVRILALTFWTMLGRKPVESSSLVKTLRW